MRVGGRACYTVCTMSDASILNNQVHWIETRLISANPYQPRIEFNDDTINELADSIRQYGILQPLTVTQAPMATADGGSEMHYELIAGERRLRASRMAGLERVPVIIRVGDTNKQRLELAIIENLQREDLNAVDRAKAFLQLAQEFSLSHTEIGKRMGKSREYVSNTLRLLALPQYILDGLVGRKISEGHTRPLLMLADKPENQKALFHDIVNYKMSVRAAEARARKEAQEKVRKEHLKTDPKILNLEEKLSNTLKARVAIETAQDGNSGRLVINYFNPDELNDLIRLMGQVTGDAALQGIEMPVAKTNILSEEKKIATATGFALSTGFLDEVSVDDDAGELLQSERHSRPDPAGFGFDAAHFTPSAPTLQEDLAEAHDKEKLQSAAQSPVPTTTQELEVAPLQLVAEPKKSKDEPVTEFTSLSELLERARKISPLDTGTLEAYEADQDMTMSSDQQEGNEESIISDAEMDKKFSSPSMTTAAPADLYSALFNI